MGDERQRRLRRCRLICGIRTPALNRGIGGSELWWRLCLPARDGGDDEVQERRMNEWKAFIFLH